MDVPEEMIGIFSISKICKNNLVWLDNWKSSPPLTRMDLTLFQAWGHKAHIHIALFSLVQQTNLAFMKTSKLALSAEILYYKFIYTLCVYVCV